MTASPGAARLLLAGALLATAQVAEAQRTELEFRDIGEILGKPVPMRAAVVSPPVVREPQSIPGTVGEQRDLDPSLEAPVARLALDARGLLAVTAVEVGAVTPAASPIVEFAFGNFALYMAVVETVRDPDFDAVHYTLVDPDSADRARLTIARNGPEIVGTVTQGGEEFRILPLTEGYQLVHRVVLHRGEFRRARGPELGSRAGQLEARHLQMAWLAERRPHEFHTNPDGRLSEFEGNNDPALGGVDIFAAMVSGDGGLVVNVERLEREIESFLDDIQHLTLIDHPVRVQILPDDSELGQLYDDLDHHTTITFRQIIDGVATADDSYIEIDRTGQVMELNADLVRSAGVERSGQAIGERDAQAAGLAAIRDLYAVDSPLEISESELLYESGNDGESPRLVWHFAFRSDRCAVMFRVEIRAISGEVERLRPMPMLGVDGRGAFSPTPRDCVVPTERR
jgi:hypothetical protein